MALNTDMEAATRLAEMANATDIDNTKSALHGGMRQAELNKQAELLIAVSNLTGISVQMLLAKALVSIEENSTTA